MAVKVFQRDFDRYKNRTSSELSSSQAITSQFSPIPVKTGRTFKEANGSEARKLAVEEMDAIRAEDRKFIKKSFDNEKDILKKIKKMRQDKDVTQKIGMINIVSNFS